MKQIKQETELLPIAKVLGKEFLVDIEKRQFRDFRNPNDIVEMHSQKGRQMVSDMQGSDWRSYGLPTGAIDNAVV